MRDRRCGLVLTMALTAACGAPAAAPPQDRPSELSAQVAAWAQEEIDGGAVAGVSVAVRQHGVDLLAEGYGYADLENDVAAGPHTVYRIGSITKQFTAAAILQLVEQGRVALDDPIDTYVDFDTQGHRVTVRHLLDHTSGIKSYTGLGEAWRRTVPLDLTHAELLGMVIDHPFDFAPGERWLYNNTGYYLLGMIVEKVSGLSYGDYLDAHVFAPAALEHTIYCDEKRLIRGRAEGYENVDGELLNDDPISMTQPFAAGALCSDVVDLMAWQTSLAAGGIVAPASYEAMTTPGSLNDGSAHGYGFGLGVGDLEGHPRIAHGGGINGFATLLSRYPDANLDIAVLTNTPGPTTRRMEQRIARSLLGLEAAETTDDQG